MLSERIPSPPKTRMLSCLPAISPHTDRFIPYFFAFVIVIAISLSTARLNSSYSPETFEFSRSTPSVYWVRSFVPSEKKSLIFARQSEVRAAAAVSMLLPTEPLS